MSDTNGASLMHIDGCHFYCWVVRKPDGAVVLTFDERQGSDLYLHKRHDCARCRDLRQINARPKHTTRDIADYPDDPEQAFVTVLAAIGEEDGGTVGLAPEGVCSSRPKPKKKGG